MRRHITGSWTHAHQHHERGPPCVVWCCIRRAPSIHCPLPMCLQVWRLKALCFADSQQPTGRGSDTQPVRCRWPRSGAGASARQLHSYTGTETQGSVHSRPESSHAPWRVQTRVGGDFPIPAGRHSRGPSFGRSGATSRLLPEGNTVLSQQVSSGLCTSLFRRPY